MEQAVSQSVCEEELFHLTIVEGNVNMLSQRHNTVSMTTKFPLHYIWTQFNNNIHCY